MPHRTRTTIASATRPAPRRRCQIDQTATAAAGVAKTAIPAKNRWNVLKSPSRAPQTSAPTTRSTPVPRYRSASIGESRRAANQAKAIARNAPAPSDDDRHGLAPRRVERRDAGRRRRCRRPRGRSARPQATVATSATPGREEGLPPDGRDRRAGGGSPASDRPIRIAQTLPTPTTPSTAMTTWAGRIMATAAAGEGGQRPGRRPSAQRRPARTSRAGRRPRPGRTA